MDAIEPHNAPTSKRNGRENAGNLRKTYAELLLATNSDVSAVSSRSLLG